MQPNSSVGYSQEIVQTLATDRRIRRCCRRHCRLAGGATGTKMVV